MFCNQHNKNAVNYYEIVRTTLSLKSAGKRSFFFYKLPLLLFIIKIFQKFYVEFCLFVFNSKRNGKKQNHLMIFTKKFTIQISKILFILFLALSL